MRNQFYKFVKKNLGRVSVCSSVCLVTSLGYYYVNNVQSPLYSRTIPDEERTKRCSELIKQYKEKNAIPGIIVGVSKNGDMVYAKGFGYSDVENCIKAKPNTIVRIASISKPITCLVAAKLMENGQLDIDKPVYDYLNDVPKLKFKNKDVIINTRQLMSHTSGIRHYKVDETCSDKLFSNLHMSKHYKDSSCSEFYMSRYFKNTKDALDLFIKDELAFEPGTGYLYSTFGYTLLSAVIEKANRDIPFQKQLIELFKRLDMNETYLDLHDQIIPYRSKYYLRDEKKRLINVPYVDVSYKYGGGGILSNVYDLVTLGNKLLTFYQSHDEDEAAGGGKKFLKSSTIRSQVWSVQSKPERNESREIFFENDLDVSYGLGWNVCFDRNKELKYVYHTGGAVGATSCLLIAPQSSTNNTGTGSKVSVQTPNGICVAVLCNSQDVAEIVPFCFNISRIFSDD